jgi:integrase
VSFRGNKREAQVKLADLIAAVGKGTYVEPSRITVAEYARARVGQWHAAGNTSARSHERYMELLEGQIVPFVGGVRVQKLKASDIEAWHTNLRLRGRKNIATGLADQTIRNAHRLLVQVLNDAVKFEVIPRNVASLQRLPKMKDKEVVALTDDQVGIVRNGLRGTPLYVPVIVSLFTGLRRGELLALRWCNVDITSVRPSLRVVEALEQTRASIRFKGPKTAAGKRTVTLPDVVAEALREHRRQQLEQRMALGLGKLPDDALVFPTMGGGPQSPNAFTLLWGAAAQRIGLQQITFHALRHTHASQLIAEGVDLVTISKRLGHSNPTVTLRAYSHMTKPNDSKAADAINTALERLGN